MAAWLHPTYPSHIAAARRLQVASLSRPLIHLPTAMGYELGCLLLIMADVTSVICDVTEHHP